MVAIGASRIAVVPVRDGVMPGLHRGLPDAPADALVVVVENLRVYGQTVRDNVLGHLLDGRSRETATLRFIFSLLFSSVLF